MVDGWKDGQAWENDRHYDESADSTADEEGGRERAERARGRGEARISTQPGSITVKLRKPRRAGWGTDLKIVVVHA